MNKNNLLIYTSGKQPINNTDYEIVERKGIGHPDSLCDGLAEKISKNYSLYCLKYYGFIFRHMIDKLALQGGSSHIVFGGGKMLKPITLFLNGRFTRIYQEETIPYFDIVKKTVHTYFNKVIPKLDVNKWLTIVNNVHFSRGPGVVYDKNGITDNEREFFFEIPQKTLTKYHNNQFRSNDTSTSVAYSPLSYLEQIVILIETTLNSNDFKKKHPFVGTDIKVMGKRVKKQIGLTVCIPFISEYTPDIDFYKQKIKFLKNFIHELVSNSFPQYEISSIELNTRDNLKKSDLYLTLTGSALESGDEGIVGRGNRYNGVIPFTRHMSMEASCGKNPVYHVGKLYTAIGSIIANEIYKTLELENYVYLTSQMGRNISNPWSACVETCKEISKEQKKTIENIVEKHLSKTTIITEKIIKEEITLF